ncbi:uncharacterized protein LOC142551780 [Primulina tabacum]|uniref:uncharacterized protein LOC142551780 n=1 Tax=Primulina tabacum TaxID=48773 RepID=UPI003F5A58FE
MASTSSLAAAQIPPAHPTPQMEHVIKHAQVALPSRRQSLLLFAATTALTAMVMPARAQDIPLFGLRKGLRNVEEEAELIVKEGLEATEKEIEVAEKELEMAEKEIEEAVRTSNLAQAGAVSVAELLGVVIASSIVNAILGPEAKKA